MSRIPDPPADLSDTSRARWPGLAADVSEVTGGAEIDFALLAGALRLEDRLAAVRCELNGAGPTVAGSRGQVRPHPLLTFETTLSRAVADAYARLRLTPDKRQEGIEVNRSGRLVDVTDR